jgi:hypothetical protein
MTQPNEMKEVRFDIYCKTCKYKDLLETEDPCESCLLEPVNLHSEKPVSYKEAK